MRPTSTAKSKHERVVELRTAAVPNRSGNEQGRAPKLIPRCLGLGALRLGTASVRSRLAPLFGDHRRRVLAESTNGPRYSPGESCVALRDSDNPQRIYA